MPRLRLAWVILPHFYVHIHDENRKNFIFEVVIIVVVEVVVVVVVIVIVFVFVFVFVVVFFRPSGIHILWIRDLEVSLATRDWFCQNFTLIIHAVFQNQFIKFTILDLQKFYMKELYFTL